MTTHRFLPFIHKARPAKAVIAPDVQRRAVRVVHHLQVLSLIAPHSVEFLEQVAADLRTRAELSIKHAAG